jgi:hypothetical protein
MARRLRYSERKAIAEQGALEPLGDEPSEELKAALIHLIAEGEGSKTGHAFKSDLRSTSIKHFGLVPVEAGPSRILTNRTVDDVLDFIEIVCEIGSNRYEVYPGRIGSPRSYARPIPNAESELNDLFDRHRFGYRLENGEIRKIGSPMLDEEIVGPALLAVRRFGWEEVDKSFREAIQHQRGGADENDDALTAANAALESALKAAGYSGDRLSTLAKSFRNSHAVPSELKGVPEALDTLLRRSGALRDNHSDAHGKAPGAGAVPQGLVDLAIHWAGAFIVYLSDAASGD